MLPPPVIVEHDGFRVVRDDLVPGGTKRRVLTEVFKHKAAAEFVYPSIPDGYGAIGVALAAKDNGKAARLFYADLPREQWSDLMTQAEEAGATMVMVPGTHEDAIAAAREYAEAHAESLLLPLGFAMPEYEEELANIARTLPVEPEQVWVASGTGTLTRAFQQAWPDAEHHAVVIKDKGSTGNAVRHMLTSEFEQAAVKPPFPSSDTFDAKVWGFMKREAKPGALFWNVGG